MGWADAAMAVAGMPPSATPPGDGRADRPVGSLTVLIPVGWPSTRAVGLLWRSLASRACARWRSNRSSGWTCPSDYSRRVAARVAEPVLEALAPTSVVQSWPPRRIGI